MGFMYPKKQSTGKTCLILFYTTFMILLHLHYKDITKTPEQTSSFNYSVNPSRFSKVLSYTQIFCTEVWCRANVMIHHVTIQKCHKILFAETLTESGN